MAGSDEIKYSDIIDINAIPKLKAEFESLLPVIASIEKAITSAMSGLKSGLGNKITSVADVENLSATIKKTTEYNEVLDKVEQNKKRLTIETAKLKIEEANHNQIVKNAAKDELGMVSIYQKESIALNDLRKQYKDLVLTNKANTAAGKELLKNVTELDAKLKKVDATVGQHQRNVGNYTSALGDMKTGLLQIGSALGLAFGVHQVIDFGKESVKAFLEAEKNAIGLKNAVHGNTIIFNKLIEQSEKLQDTSIFSDDDIQIAQKALATYGLTSDQITKLTPQIVDYASKMGVDLATATTTAISAINGQTKGLKESGLQFKDTGDRVENFNVLTEKLTKFQGASAEALETTIGKAKRLENAFDNIKESIGEYLVGVGSDILDNFEVVFGGKAVDIALFRQKEKVLAMMDEVNAKSLEKIEKGEKLKSAVIADNNKYIAELFAQRGKAENFEQQKVIDAQIKHQQKFNAELRLLGKKETNDWETEEDKKVEKTKETHKETEKEYYEHQKKMQKIRDEAMKVEKLEEMKAEDVAFSSSVASDIEGNISKVENDKKAQEEEYKMAVEKAEMLYDIWKENRDRMAEENMAYIDRELDQNQSNIDQQFQLASQGKANTLAFEMQKKDELEKGRMEELERQKKVAKQQEAIELSLAFLKAYENYIGKDMKSGEALGRAFMDVSAAKLLSKSLAGSALEGTEDTGRGGNLDANGGMLWKLHPHERVLTKEQNDKLGGMSNDDLVRNAMLFDNIMTPQFNSSLVANDVSKSKQVNDSMSTMVVKKLEELNNTIKNKAENSTNIDNLGNLIKRKFENGIQTISTRKNFIN